MPEDNYLTLSTTWMADNLIGFVTAVIVLVVGFAASRFFSSAVGKMMPRARGVDQTIAPILSQVTRYAILILALVIALSQLGVQTASILAVLGAAGLAIALALQGTLSNIAAGVMLIWLRPMSIGEYIDGKGIAGTVVEIGLFGTRLRTADGVYVFAPNSQLWDAAITNFSREPRRRIDLRIGISYESSIADAREQLLSIGNNDRRVLSDPAPAVYVENLGDSAVVLLFRVWVPTTDYWNALYEFTEKAKLAFDEVGIEIPYNKLDINVAGMEAVPVRQVDETTAKK